MALDLALMGRQHSIADTLLKHGASVTTTDPTGASLLHRAVRRGEGVLLSGVVVVVVLLCVVRRDEGVLLSGVVVVVVFLYVLLGVQVLFCGVVVVCVVLSDLWSYGVTRYRYDKVIECMWDVLGSMYTCMYGMSV